MKTVDHIALLVDNLDESQKWYEENVNAVCVFSDKNYRRMQTFNTTIALVCKYHYSYNHIGILPKNGGRVEHRDGTVGVYVFDNSGHCIEFIYYSPEVKKKMDI